MVNESLFVENMIEVALKTLSRTGFGMLAREFLTPLLDNELKHGTTQACDLRTHVQGQVKQGQALSAAIIDAMCSWSKRGLEER